MSGPTYVRITADVTDLTAKLAVAKADFANTNTELRNMAQQMNAAGSSASGELRAGLQVAAEAAAKSRTEMASLNRELRETTNATHSGGLKDIVSFGESGLHIRFREMAESFGALGLAIGAAFAGREILEGIEHTAELGANLLKLSEQTGIAVEALSGLHYAAEQEDVSAESLDTSVKRLGKSIQEALHVPTSAAADGFHEMGISQQFLRDHSNDTMAVLLKMADAFHTHADGAQADAVAMATLGRGGVEMIPVLRQGSEEIQKQIEKQKELGSQITGPMAEAMKQHIQAVKDMKEAWQGLWLRLADSGILKVLTYLAVGFEKIAEAVGSAAVGVKALIALWDLLNGKVSSSPKNLGDFGAEQAPGGHPYQMKSDLPAFKPRPPKEKKTKEAHDFYAQWKEQLDQTLLAQQLFGEQAKAYELRFWQEKLVVAQDGGKNYVGATRSITSQVYNLENEAYRKSIEDAKRAEAEKKRAKDEGYRNFKAKIDEEREAAAGNIAEQIRLDQELVDRAKALYGQDSANFQEALKRKTADMKAEVDKQMQPYQKLVSTIGNSFDEMFRGIIEGQQSFRQIMGRLTLGLIEDFARMAIRNVETWALSKLREVIITQQVETMKTGAVAAGETAQAGIRTAAAAEGKAASAAAGSVSVFGDANKAAAGAYAAVAGIPVVGPILAPIAAATAFGAVLAFDVFSASGGMDIGPGVNPMVQLHEKEMVLPGNLADRVRNITDPSPATGHTINLAYHAATGGNHKSDARDIVDIINHQIRIGRLKLA